jgi:hypothetical protein
MKAFFYYNIDIPFSKGKLGFLRRPEGPSRLRAQLRWPSDPYDPFLLRETWVSSEGPKGLQG